MFGFKGNGSRGRMPKPPGTMISPNNYGYSHVFLDDADQMVLEWEFNGGIPPEGMLEKLREIEPERARKADESDEIKERISSLVSSNARIISNLSASKSKAAQGTKRQYDAWNRHFGNMDKLESGYELSKSRRDHKLADIRETFDYACANLRVSSGRRSTQRAQQLEKAVTAAAKPPKNKKKRKQKATV